MGTALLRYFALPLALWLTGCASSDSVADVLRVGRVEVTPPSAAIGPQETLQLTATPLSEGGLELPPRDVSWSSSAPNLVTVSASGLVRALAVGGPVTVTATIEGVDGSTTITVTPVPVARVVVTPSQSNLQTGGTVQLTATAYDAGGAVLPGRAFFWDSNAPSIAPVTTGGLVIAQSDGGPVTITASTGGKSGSASVSVAPRPATRLGFVQQPTSTVEGHVIVPAVKVAIQDDLLHTIGSASNSVTITLANNPSGAVLSGTTTVAAVAGVATFSDLSLDKSGTGVTLLATASGLSAALSNSFDVRGLAARLTITTQPPGSAQSGVALTRQPIILVSDAAGNPVAGASVTAAIASGSGSLGGTVTVTSGSNGSALFTNLVIRGTVGTYKLSFSAAGAPAVTSANIGLTAGPAAQLFISTQPSSSALAGFSFLQQPVLRLKDAEGNFVSQSGVAVSAAINTATASGTLGGTTTVNTSGSGTASFSGLKLSKAGSYTLIFRSGSLTPAISITITVN